MFLVIYRAHNLLSKINSKSRARSHSEFQINLPGIPIGIGNVVDSVTSSFSVNENLYRQKKKAFWDSDLVTTEPPGLVVEEQFKLANNTVCMQ